MNKSSLLGLIVGLVILNLLFFAIGFLVAVTTLGPSTAHQAPAWEDVAYNISKLQNVARGVGGAYIEDRVLDTQGRVGKIEQRFTRAAPAALQPFAQYIGERAGYQARHSISQAPEVIRQQITHHNPIQSIPQGRKQTQNTPMAPTTAATRPQHFSASSASSPFHTTQRPVASHHHTPPSSPPIYRKHS